MRDPVARSRRRGGGPGQGTPGGHRPAWGDRPGGRKGFSPGTRGGGPGHSRAPPRLLRGRVEVRGAGRAHWEPAHPCPSNEDERVIRFENVTKVYQGTTRPAVDNVSLEIVKGEFVFLVGASGSGKSTFLRLVLREERASRGGVHVAGKDGGGVGEWEGPQARPPIG